MTIRSALLTDLTRIKILIQELGYEVSKNTLMQRYETFLSNPGYGISVIEFEDLIVGFVAWSKSMVFLTGATRFHVEALIIDSKYQGKGLGKKLLSFVETIAKSYTPSIVDLTSGKRRAKEGTHDFYKKCGYQNEGFLAKIYLKKEIPSE